MSVPSGLFAPGGLVHPPKRAMERPIVPLEWFKAHPLTKRWYARAFDTNVGLAFVTNTLLQLDSGFEGYLRDFMLIGGWNSGVNDGRNWSLLIDGANVIQSRLLFGGTLNVSNFDILPGGSDGTNTWATLDLWLDEAALVQVSYNNNGGSAGDQLGAVAYGFYWPVTLRDEWLRRGWKR